MEPCDLDAVEARRLIGCKRLSAVELVESCIARILAVDPAVNAMVARDFDRARAAARACDAATMQGGALGSLHGLPLGVKDLGDVAGLRTTYGSVLFRDHVPGRDQRIVQAARQAGAIVLGKTNTPEWGAGANTRNAVYGATGNPFDPMRSAAGSSGGSAVVLATGMAPLATGSDTGGSLRNPAASLRHRRLPAHAGPGAERGASARLEPASGAGADGAHGAGPVPAAVLHGVR